MNTCSQNHISTRTKLVQNSPTAMLHKASRCFPRTRLPVLTPRASDRPPNVLPERAPFAAAPSRVPVPSPYSGAPGLFRGKMVSLFTQATFSPRTLRSTTTSCTFLYRRKSFPSPLHSAGHSYSRARNISLTEYRFQGLGLEMVKTLV